jgi:hypothetical protein
MLRTYPIGGRQVTVNWIPQQHPPVYTIVVASVSTTGSVEKTPAGRFLALDGQHRLLGAFQGLRAAVECVIRDEQRGG